MADVAPASVQTRPAAGGRPDQGLVDQVVGILRQTDLEAKRGQVASVLMVERHGDPEEAAHAAVQWRRAGRTKTRDGATLLRAALRSQDTRLGPRWRDERWCRENVPELPAAYALSALYGARAAFGRAAVDAGRVRARALSRFAVELDPGEVDLGHVEVVPVCRCGHGLAAHAHRGDLAGCQRCACSEWSQR